MKTAKHPILIAAILATGLLPGCDFWGGPNIDEDIKAFVESENLPDVQTPSVEFKDSDLGVKAFRVPFGPGCDCPSGCIYSKGYGIELRDRTGWMDVTEVFFCSEDSLDTGELNYFDVRPGDSTLFGSEFRNRFRKATEDRDPDGYAPIYEVFLQMLAGDEDSPVRTLRSLTDLLFEHYLPETADALIQNPVVRSNTSLLERLAELPDQAAYLPVREKARELLNESSED
jgi:hypothetical protein